jgi:hypothetical protein
MREGSLGLGLALLVGGCVIQTTPADPSGPIAAAPPAAAPDAAPVASAPPAPPPSTASTDEDAERAIVQRGYTLYNVRHKDGKRVRSTVWKTLTPADELGASPGLGASLVVADFDLTCGNDVVDGATGYLQGAGALQLGAPQRQPGRGAADLPGEHRAVGPRTVGPVSATQSPTRE